MNHMRNVILNTLKPVEHRHRLSHTNGIILYELGTDTTKTTIQHKRKDKLLMSSAPKLINQENDAIDLEN